MSVASRTSQKHGNGQQNGQQSSNRENRTEKEVELSLRAVGEDEAVLALLDGFYKFVWYKLA